MRFLLLSDIHINLPDADVGYAVMDVTDDGVTVLSASH
jgi:hypothetical protein